MKEGIAYTGVLSKRELENSPSVPKKERLNRGPVAVIECIQEIPCDPCVSACPFGAITIKGSPKIPHLDEEKCMGCGMCVAQCPGLAIFLVDMTYSKTEALVSFPYEFLPLPKVGMDVAAVNREGKLVTEGKVVKVRSDKKYDKTTVISVAVPKEFAQEVRCISLKRRRYDE